MDSLHGALIIIALVAIWKSFQFHRQCQKAQREADHYQNLYWEQVTSTDRMENYWIR